MRIIEQPRIICENDSSLFGYFAWPTVARLNDGTLAAVCSGFRVRHVCPFGKAVIFYSRDEGRSWTKPAPVIDTPLDDRDAGICVLPSAGDSNTVIVTSFNNTPEFQRSVIESSRRKGDTSRSLSLMEAYLNTVPADACETFLGSTYKISRDGGYTFGLLMRSPVTSPHGPCVLPDGRVMWVGKGFGVHNEPTGIKCCVFSDEGRFEVLSEIPGTVSEDEKILFCEPHAIALPDGRIFVAIRVQKYGEIFTVYTTESRDGGRTFDVPVQAIGTLDGAPPHLMLTKDGRLLMTYACRNNGNYGIRARISGDLGRTWQDEMALTEFSPNPDLGYPASVVLKNGDILTVYYENDGRTSHIKQLVWRI